MNKSSIHSLVFIQSISYQLLGDLFYNQKVLPALFLDFGVSKAALICKQLWHNYFLLTKSAEIELTKLFYSCNFEGRQV